MRIIAGRLKGRRLARVRGPMRPTADRVREAVFNILGPVILGARVLDLFAGAGALGIEALSRGAGDAVFVENHRISLQILCRNLILCGLDQVSSVLPLSVARALLKLAGQGRYFDLVFLDPPYGRGMAAATLMQLATTGIVAPTGRVIVEHSRQEDLEETYRSLVYMDQRRYGGTLISFYASRSNESSDLPEEQGDN